jgi:hypothetical protein
LGAAFLLLAARVISFWWWSQDEPRRGAIQALDALVGALQAANTKNLLQAIAIPTAVRTRTASEQAGFLTKALREEISPEGLRLLRQQGQSGALTNLFPDEAAGWAAQADVAAEQCVAFKAEKNGVRAEVVLSRSVVPTGKPGHTETVYRVVRGNNVKQLATLAPPMKALSLSFLICALSSATFAPHGIAATFTNQARVEIADPTGGLSWNPTNSPTTNALTVQAWFKTMPAAYTHSRRR